MSDMVSRKEARAQQEKVAMAALEALPKHVFGELRTPDVVNIIRSVIDRIDCDAELRSKIFARFDNKQYAEKCFKSFLVRSFNFMGCMTDEEVAEADERSMHCG